MPPIVSLDRAPKLVWRKAAIEYAPCNPIRRAGIGSETIGGGTIRELAQIVQHMGAEPFPVPEQSAKRQGDLAVLIAFGAGRERAGVTQDITPVLKQFRLAVERTIRRQCASNRRHDATYVDSRSP